MTAPRPTFRVLKNGYDRFAVDDAVERYAAQVDSLEKQVEACRSQLAEADRKLAELQARYDALNRSMDARSQAADSIARLSIKEANEIISAAQKDADAIVHESLVTARLILTDLSRLYGDADMVKDSTKKKLEGLLTELDEFQLPKMPDLRWLNEAEKKMR